MLLIRAESVQREAARLYTSHRELVSAAHDGSARLNEVHGEKLARLLATAARSDLYRETFPEPVRRRLAGAEPIEPKWALEEALPALPLLEKHEVGEGGQANFTRPISSFVHYYESSGTTGIPLPAPKAMDDLIVNTVNIGEMWARIVHPGDTAMILINAPFAPAAYQFEKVLEYLGVMSVRPWVDNVTGDYLRVLRLVEELGVNVYVGPPSRLLELLGAAHREGRALPRFSTLLLMAEQTGPAFQAHLERLTGGRAYSSAYGSSETGTTAVTCEEGSFHLQTQSFVLELLDENGTRPLTGAADAGELVVTTLDLPARPLLRYRTGDLIEVTGEKCACGLALPVMRTRGRAQDVLSLTGRGVRQNEVEAALWAPDAIEPTVLNYMLVLRGTHVLCLATTLGEAPAGWAERVGGQWAALFPGRRLTVKTVRTLPPLASLGAYMGWKLSRVLNLDEERNWARLPAPINAIVRAALEEVREMVP